MGREKKKTRVLLLYRIQVTFAMIGRMFLFICLNLMVTIAKNNYKQAKNG